MFKDNKSFAVLINITLVLLIILLLTRISFILNPVAQIGRILLLPLIISIFLYYAVKPLLGLFRKSRIGKSLQIIIVLLGIVLVLSIIFYYGGSVIGNQFSNFLSANAQIISGSKSFINEKLGQFLPDFELSQNIINSANTVLKKMAESMGSLFGQLGNIGTQIILVPFLLFYFLKDDDGFTKGFLSIIPNRYKNITKDTLRQIDTVLSTYISGQLLVALVIGILMYIGYLFIGMPNAILMSFFSMIKVNR
jgi:predicted PurR-regulated permease PerM